MAGKFFLIDTTKCTACRGCQVACKEWKKLPADTTKQTGTYQNPPDFDGNTYRLVRFAEYPSDKNYMVWYFFSDACRHCLEPPCKEEADNYLKGAIEIDAKTGGVVYTSKTKKIAKNFQAVRDTCPYDVPRMLPSGQFTKCDMCVDRVSAGLLPACVKACPTGALMFGSKAEIAALPRNGWQRPSRNSAKGN